MQTRKPNASAATLAGTLIVRGAPIALLAAVSACSVLPVRPDLATLGEEELANELERTGVLTAPSLAALDGETIAAWEGLADDPLLIAYISEGLKANPSLRASAESVARAEALVRAADSARLPFLGFSVGANASSPLEDPELRDTFSAGLSADWEADLWGRLSADVRAANLDLIGTDAFFQSARQSLAAEIARTYVQGIEADLQVGVAQAQVDALQETLRLVQVRKDLGFSPRSELVLAESDLAGAYDSVESLKANARAIRRRLSVLLGRQPNPELPLAASLPAFRTPVLTGTPTEALRARPDIQAAEVAVRANYTDIASLEAGRWPSLTFSGALNGSGDLEDLVDPAAFALSFGARLANSLFDGGLTRARLDAASATARQSVADYGAQVLSALLEVETRADDIATLARRREYQETAAEASRETLRLAEIQYREGEIDLLDVLTFRQRALSADRSLVTLARLETEARIALYLAMGGGALPLAD